jgi:hypothetical protein
VDVVALGLLVLVGFATAFLSSLVEWLLRLRSPYVCVNFLHVETYGVITWTLCLLGCWGVPNSIMIVSSW